jgi:hypothetical protein
MSNEGRTKSNKCRMKRQNDRMIGHRTAKCRTTWHRMSRHKIVGRKMQDTSPTNVEWKSLDGWKFQQTEVPQMKVYGRKSNRQKFDGRKFDGRKFDGRKSNGRKFDGRKSMDKSPMDGSSTNECLWMKIDIVTSKVITSQNARELHNDGRW